MEGEPPSYFTEFLHLILSRPSQSPGQMRNHAKFLLAGKLTSLGEIAQFENTGCSIYFAVVGGGATVSLCCAQAPSPKAVARTAMIMIIFRNFNLSTSFCRGLLRFV